LFYKKARLMRAFLCLFDLSVSLGTGVTIFLALRAVRLPFLRCGLNGLGGFLMVGYHKSSAAQAIHPATRA
jgi:hypothetical protein